MKTRRQNKILELIQHHSIDTQEELLRILNQNGFAVTQATVSRDIKELRLIKTLDSEGNYRYSPKQRDVLRISSKFQSMFYDTVISIENSNNVIVVKCIPGMAQGVCAALDSMGWEEILGTIAGDDTIFVVARNENFAENLVEKLKENMSL